MAGVSAWCARHPWRVLLAALLLAFGCALLQRSLPRDVIPDLADPQLALIAEWMGHPASEVASKVTHPLTRELQRLPGVTAVRGASMTGMAYVDVVFEDAATAKRQRAQVLAKVERLRAALPSSVQLRVGPDASSTGWVYQYALMPPDRRQRMPMGEQSHEGNVPLAPLREFQDRVLRPALDALPGVAEVATVGGEGQQVLIETTPERLARGPAALSDVISAALGVLATQGATAERLQDARVALGERGGTLDLGDVATVRTAPDHPAGAADVDGLLPIVSGIVIAERDADVPELIARVRAEIERQRARLPAGTQLGVIYDRSQLIERVEHTLLRALGEEIAVVVLVVLLFLGHARSALVPMITLPLVVLVTLAAMKLLGLPATVMSLGGIAIALGMAVDADLVALEACHRRLEGSSGERRSGMLAAAGTFVPPLLISLLIAAIAFLPVFAFTGETGRLLRPLALTKTLVILAAALVTLTVAPALRDRLLRGRVAPEMGNPLTRNLVRAYRPFVHFALAHPAFTLITAALLALSCVPILPRLGSEFLPRIDEGDLLYMPTSTAGASAADAERELSDQDAALAARPEVAMAFGKIGRADTATDPAPFSMAETIVRLAPREHWPLVSRERWYSGWAPPPLARALGWLWPERTPLTSAELVESLDGELHLPGWTNAWTAPVRARIDMMATGVRAPVGIRVSAADPPRLAQLGERVQNAARALPGTRSAVYEASGGETRLVFQPDAAAVARHRVDPELVRATADQMLSGGQLGAIAGAFKPLPVRVSLAQPWQPRPADALLREVSVRSRGEDGGQPVPLALLGRPVFEHVPSVLRAERGALVGYVHVELAAGADVLAYVSRAKDELARSVTLAPGERIEWTGQYPLIADGQRRLALIAPLVALTMLLLLVLQFRSAMQALIVLAAVPFALVGSFWTLYLLDYPLSAPVWVGLLSVVGLAMQTGVVMVVYIDEVFHRRVREGTLNSRADIIDAHAEGTVQRLRPKLMTVLTMAAGLLPLLWADGSGAEIMRRVAAPMIGGLVTSAFLTLEVIPVLYTIWRTAQLRRAQTARRPLHEVVGIPLPPESQQPAPATASVQA